MKYDGLLIILSLLVVALLAVELLDMAALTVVVVLIVLIAVVQRAGFGHALKKVDEKTDKIHEILSKVEDVSKKFDNFKDDITRQVTFVDGRVSEVRNFVEVEVQNTHMELSRRLAEVEDKFNDMKQTLSAAIGSLDERIRAAEEKKDEEEPTDSIF